MALFFILQLMGNSGVLFFFNPAWTAALPLASLLLLALEFNFGCYTIGDFIVFCLLVFLGRSTV